MRNIKTYSVIHDKFVHPARSKGGPDCIDNGSTGVDVGDNLLLAMGILRPFLQQQDLRLHYVVRSSTLQLTKIIIPRKPLASRLNLAFGKIYKNIFTIICYQGYAMVRNEKEGSTILYY